MCCSHFILSAFKTAHKALHLKNWDEHDIDNLDLGYGSLSWLRADRTTDELEATMGKGITTKHQSNSLLKGKHDWTTY